ncbi:MAG TPA: TonB-dependent receptor [Exilispira sp.]|nr:TonB-dependent receptor [Exilispira sp.]
MKNKINIKKGKKNYFIVLFLFIFSLLLFIFLSSFQTLAQEITINVTDQSEQQTTIDVEVYDEQDLEESLSSSLTEFLQTQSFLYIAKGVDDSEIGFLILRGFSNSRIAIFLDGIPISLSQINALKLPLNLISKIVIYKGNVSALFGPNAIGGAILIWTKDKKQGAINFGSLYLSSLVNFGGFFHLSSFNNNIFSSFDLNAKYFSNSYDDSFGKSDFYDIFSKFLIEFDSFSFSFLVDYYKKFLPNDIQFPYFNTYKESLSLLTFFRLNDFLISFEYINEYFSCHDYTYKIDEKRELFYGFLSFPFIIYKNDTTTFSSNISLKFEYLKDDTLIFDEVYGGLLSTCFILNKSFISLFDLLISLSLDLNAKYSNKLDYFLIPSLYLNLSKKFDLSDKLNFSIYTKLGTGYRLPSFSELFTSYGIVAIGNPDLKPEKSYGIEFGAGLNSNKFETNLSFYYYYFDDFIVWIRRFDNRFKPINFAKGYNLGLDFEIQYSIPIGEESYIQFSPLISLIIPKILEGQLILNEVYVPYVPLANIIFDIDYVYTEKLRLKLEFIYRGIRFITIENYNWFSPYFLINFDLTYYISQKSNVSFSIKNLLGTTYYDLLYYPVSNITFDLEFSFYF